MAVSYFGEAHVSNGGTTAGAAVVPVPASVPAGALMLLAVLISSTTITVTTPAGWTEVALPVNNITTEAQLRVYQRVGASEPSTYTVTFSAAARYSCAITVYPGAELGPVSSNADATPGLTHQSAFVTPVSSGTWIWTAWGARTGAAVGFGGWTPPAGDTERLDIIGSNSSVNVALGVNDSNAPVSLVSQNRVAGTAENRITVAAILCLRPAGGTSHPVNPTGIVSVAALGTTVLVHTRLLRSGGIASGEALGGTVVTHTRLVRTGGIPSGEALGVTTVVHTRLLRSGGIGSAEALGTTTVVHTRAIRSGGIPSGEALGTTTIGRNHFVVSGGIPSGEALGTTTLVHTSLITSGGIGSAEALGTTSLVHTRLIVSGGIPSGEALGTTVVAPLNIHTVITGGIPSREALGVTTIRRAVRTVGCEPWPLLTTCIPSAWGNDPNAYPPQAQAAIAAAQELLDRMSGHQFGICVVKIRPCRKRCAETLGAFGRLDNLGVGFAPLLDGGRVYNVPCGCGGPCGCGPLCEVTLPGRVRDVLEVLVDGEVVPPEAYEVNANRDLVRVDGGCWPDCQDFTRPDTQPGTWSVLYSRGVRIGPAGSLALTTLAVELWKGMCGQADCKLPARVTSVVRDGVTYDIANALDVIAEDRFGILEVDAWLQAVNPRKARARMAAWSPDLPQYRRKTS